MMHSQKRPIYDCSLPLQLIYCHVRAQTSADIIATYFLPTNVQWTYMKVKWRD